MYVLHHKVNTTGALKYVLHAHNKWMINLQHNQTFQVYVLDRFFVDNYVFAHAFERIVLARRLKVYEEHFGEGTPANHRDHLKLLKRGTVTFRAF